ncbi:hypothetical protein CP556_09520 [Natrinema sp. CBA1119]|uniref:hypothetical protein n=1 Tax=Natrinema sp. CBA1119 TaxID=1608465 RepID=UPI000BF2B825|nr:hypothetical protein [Natrinema sp. CBA1119]PGF16329.1 hypothetical protein CP556_09520 [Natrinema sp. CBA1119]
MGSGSRSGRQLLSVIALVCAIGGLILAAGALPTLASDSPASGIFDGAADGQASGETTTSSAAAAGSAASGSSGTSGLDSGFMASLADSPLIGGVLSNLLDGSAGSQPRPDVDGASMDDLEGSDDAGMQSDGTSGETDSTDGSGETGSTDSSGETGATDGSDGSGSTEGSDGTGSTDGSAETGSTDGSDGAGSTDGSDGTDSTDDSSGTDSTDGGGETGSSSGGTDGDQSTSEQEAGGADGQTSAARGEDGSDAGADESEADDGSDSEDSDGGEDGDDSSLTDSVSDRAVTAGLVVVATLIVGYVFYTREDPIGTLLAIPGRLVSLALAGVVACSQALERALVALRGLRSIADLPGLVLATITDAIRSARTRAREVGSSVSTSLFGGAEAATDTDAAGDAQPGARERIRRAFESVIDASPMYRTRVATATPGDVARSATDAGAPGEPVETITDSFRDVEYGDRDPDAYLERTATAHDRLRDALESADETDGGGSDSSGDPDE